MASACDHVLPLEWLGSCEFPSLTLHVREVHRLFASRASELRCALLSHWANFFFAGSRPQHRARGDCAAAHSLSQKSDGASHFRISLNLAGCTGMFCCALRSDSFPDGPQHVARVSPSDEYWWHDYGAILIDSRTTALDSPVRTRFSN